MLLALVPTSLLAAPERVADILHDLQTHGYVSPDAAVERLQAATDANDARAPLDQRRRYYATLIALAAADRDTPLLQQSLDQLARIAEREHCSPCQASWLIGKAQAEIAQRDLRQARAHLQQAATLIPANDAAMRLELALGQVGLERQQGALNVAFSHAMKGLGLAEKLGDAATHTLLQLDLTVIDTELGFLPRAATVAKDTIARAQAIGFTAALAQAYINQAYVYSQLEQHPEQLRALEKALAVSRDIPGLTHVQAAARINLSDYYLSVRDYGNALTFGREGAALAKSDHDPYLTSVALANVGLAEAGMGRTQDALQTLQHALDIARQSGNLRAQSIISRELVKQLQAAKRYREALLVLQSIDAVNQAITAQKRDTAVLELQAKYDDERKDRQIEQLSTQARLVEAQAAARRWQQRMWTTLAAVAVATALLLVLWLARARHANRRLTQDIADLTEQTSLDELTGTFNRRHFATMMQPYEHDPDARVGLVMVDIDHFKRVNDDLGHDAGDSVLKEVARRLRALVRERDHVVRWGGEEFVLVLPDASAHGLPVMARRLLDAVAGQPIEVGGRQVCISISAGCVVHPLEPGDSWEAAMRMADTAMYRAKRLGRNRAACVTLPDGAARQPAEGDRAATTRTSTAEIVDIDGPQLSPGAAALD